MEARNGKESSRYLLKIGYYALVTAVLLGVLFSLYTLFLPLVLSILLVFLLEPLVNSFETKGYRRITVIVGICFAGISIAILGAVYVLPGFYAEARSFAENLPEYKLMVANAMTGLQDILETRFPQVDWPDFVLLLQQRFPGSSGLHPDALVAGLASVFSLLSIAAIIPIATFFLLLDGHRIHKFVMNLVPNKYFEMVVLLTHRVVTSVKLFLRGQLIDAAAVGVLTTVGMALIGLPYAIVVGIIAGMGNLIPYLGPVIGFIPALLVLFMMPEGFSVVWLIKIVVVFGIVQFVEGTFVYPFAVGKSVNLHPLVVILGITIGGQFGGIVGMILVIPLISIVKVTLEVLHTYLKSYMII